MNSINTKDRLYKTLLKTDTNSDDYRVAKTNFKRYREILHKSLKMAKMLYYKKTFNLYENDVKKTCALIKEILQQKKKHELPTEFIWNDRIITDLDEIANKFNTYFIILVIHCPNKFMQLVPVTNILVIGQTQFLTSQKLMKSALIALLKI